jgi:hypothetical protein
MPSFARQTQSRTTGQWQLLPPTPVFNSNQHLLHSSTTNKRPSKLDTTECQNLTSPAASKRWTTVKAKLVRGSFPPRTRVELGELCSLAVNQLIRIKSKATTDKKNLTGPELTAQLSSGSLAMYVTTRMLRSSLDGRKAF